MNPKSISQNYLAARVVSTGASHKAGSRGNFSIYKIIPIVNVLGKWYDCGNLNALPPASVKSESIQRVRYLQLAGDDVTTDFTKEFSSSSSP